MDWLAMATDGGPACAAGLVASRSADWVAGAATGRIDVNRAVLARRLKTIRERAPHMDMTVRTHLFGIEYADELRDFSLRELKEIMVLAEAPESMATEMKKCVKIADYVTVNRETRTR